MRFLSLIILLGGLVSCDKGKFPPKEMKPVANDDSTREPLKSTATRPVPPAETLSNVKLLEVPSQMSYVGRFKPFCVFQYEGDEPAWFETPGSIIKVLIRVINEKKQASPDEFSRFKDTYEFIFLDIGGLGVMWGRDVIQIAVNGVYADPGYVDSSGSLGKHFKFLWKIERMHAPFNKIQIMRYDEFFENSVSLKMYGMNKLQSDFLEEMQQSFKAQEK